MNFFYTTLLFIIIVTSIGNQGMAADILPPSADSGRFGAEREQLPPSSPPKYLPSVASGIVPAIKVPDEAKNISFTLKKVIIEGASAFTEEELQPFYQPYLNQKIRLDFVWQIAADITKHYQDSGYFLAQALVPQQEVSSGVLKIKVVEGYIGEIVLDNEIGRNYVVMALIEKLKAEKPINIKTLESVALALNDLPALSFRSVIKPLDSATGAVKLILVGQKKHGSGQITVDNYNSMYLGPYESIISYETSILPLNKTSLIILRSSPEEKLRYFSASNDFTIAPSVIIGVFGGRTHANPGFTLKPLEIDSVSDNFGISISRQIIRQRQQNLAVKFKIESKDISSDILYTPLTRDHIRSAAINLTYNGSDLLGGYNYISTTVTQGLDSFGASKPGDLYLSRTNVKSDFHKIELNLTRFQGVGKYWMSVLSSAMQFASGSLYSSDQFGYGGQAFGRAYDSSEISGDKGMNAGLEMRYTAIPTWHNITFVPFAFYDAGKVWSSGEVSKYRNSIGEGFRIESASGLSASFTIANPLIHGVATPRYSNSKAPRYLFQLSYRF